MMHDRPATRRRPEDIGLLAALAVSVAVHLLLFVLALLLPDELFVVARTMAAEPDTAITFSFTPPGEELPAEPPPGEVPLELPRSPPLPPPSEPARPEPEVAPAEPEPIPPAPPPPAPAPERPSPARRPQSAPADVDRPPQERGPATGLDLSRALEEYRRSLDLGRPAAPPRSAQEGTPRNVYVPDLGQLPTTGYGVGNLTFESRDYEWDDYGRQIYNAIWRAWHNRLWATTADFEKWSHQNQWWVLAHEVGVRFVIERNGSVSGIVIEAPSAGCWPLDNSATQALDEVILPPLPPDFPRDREVVHARFIARGDVREMRPALRYLKSLGLF